MIDAHSCDKLLDLLRDDFGLVEFEILSASSMELALCHPHYLVLTPRRTI